MRVITSDHERTVLIINLVAAICVGIAVFVSICALTRPSNTVPVYEPEPIAEVHAIDTAPVTCPELDPLDVTEVIAKAVFGEANNCTVTEQAAVVWCICNRYDAGYGDLIHIVTAPGGFYGYSADNPVDPDILALVQDVLTRWAAEKVCVGSVGRVLPKDYRWFCADDNNRHNIFRNSFEGGNRWDWSLPSPYEEATT